MKNIYYFFNGCMIVLWSCVKDLFTGDFIETYQNLFKDIINIGKNGELIK